MKSLVRLNDLLRGYSLLGGGGIALDEFVRKFAVAVESSGAFALKTPAIQTIKNLFINTP